MSDSYLQYISNEYISQTVKLMFIFLCSFSLEALIKASSFTPLRIHSLGSCIIFLDLFTKFLSSFAVCSSMLLENSSSSLVWLLLFILSLHPSGCVPVDSVLAPFAGLVRERLLYTDSRNQGFFLEIVADGSVRASPDPSSNCVLELRSVRPGETVIRGVAASLFLCVNPAGHLRGQWHYTEEDCTFRELLVDSYTMFLSPHTSLPVSLRSKRSGKKRGHLHLSHFLPVVNPGLLTEEEERQEPGIEEDSGVNSEDPFGFGRMSQTHSIVSPSMHRKKKRRGLQ